MAHQLDYSKGFYGFTAANGAAAWHGLGKIFDGDLSTADALQHSGLDFTVLKLPNIHYLPNGEELISNDSFFTVRTDTNKVLGSRLGADYEVLQNIECFDLVDEILQSGRAKIETAGSLNGGRKAFICLRVSQDIRLDSSDVVKQFVLLATSHDGSMSITAMPTNIRVVCNNTLSAALGSRVGQIKIRHSQRSGERLAEAARVLKLIASNTELNAEAYGKMKQTRFDERTMFDYFGNIFFSDAEIKAFQDGKKAQDVLSSQKINTVKKVTKFLHTGAGQALTMDGGNFTAWSAYNAVTGIISRKEYKDVNDRANSMMFGSAWDNIKEAGVLALAPEKLKPCRPSGSSLVSGFNLN